MSYNDRYGPSRRQPASRNTTRGTFTYWLPLAFTVTAATIGLVAWVWSERSDDDEELRPPPTGHGPPPAGDHTYQDYVRHPDGSLRNGPPSYTDVRPGEVVYGTSQQRPDESQSYIARMSGALRRTPSPQQVFDGATRSMAAGVATAGAVVGNALSSIREEDKNTYEDHRTWSEEAEARATGVIPTLDRGIQMRPRSEAGVVTRVPLSNRKRKTVALVVSTEEHLEFDEDDEHHEHASILSHLPRNTDFSTTRFFVLIYAPNLKEHPLDAATRKPPGSLSSSFLNIQTPGEEHERTLSTPSSSAFNTVYSQALGLVEKETMVLPFTTSTGHVHILRHLAPDIVYLQEALAGNNGDVITHLQSWLRQDVVLVVGVEGGHGGLADSESEAENVEKNGQWWQREDRVGRGRGVVVIEGVRVGDDWARRVQQRD